MLLKRTSTGPSRYDFFKISESTGTYQLSVTQVIDILYHSDGFRLLQVAVYRPEQAE